MFQKALLIISLEGLFSQRHRRPHPIFASWRAERSFRHLSVQWYSRQLDEWGTDAKILKMVEKDLQKKGSMAVTWRSSTERSSLTNIRATSTWRPSKACQAIFPLPGIQVISLTRYSLTVLRSMPEGVRLQKQHGAISKKQRSCRLCCTK